MYVRTRGTTDQNKTRLTVFSIFSRKWLNTEGFYFFICGVFIHKDGPTKGNLSFICSRKSGLYFTHVFFTTVEPGSQRLEKYDTSWLPLRNYHFLPINEGQLPGISTPKFLPLISVAFKLVARCCVRRYTARVLIENQQKLQVSYQNKENSSWLPAM
jgi:hypothetical protein